MRFQFFPSLFQRPNKIKFDQQEDNETIELFLRQHPIVNVGWISLSLLLLLLPPFLLQMDIIFGFNYADRVPINLLLGGLVIYYLLLLAYAFEEFLSWYFNVYIVTNQHVVDINFYSILAKEVIEISLDDIEVISQHVAGVFSSLFHYGDVTIETAAENVVLLFKKVPRPDLVADRIQDLQRNRKLFFEGEKP